MCAYALFMQHNSHRQIHVVFLMFLTPLWRTPAATFCLPSTSLSLSCKPHSHKPFAEPVNAIWLLKPHITCLHRAAIAQAAAKISEADLDRLSSPSSFDTQLHYVDTSSAEGCARTVQALFVVDALNFCFWPGGATYVSYSHNDVSCAGCVAAPACDEHAVCLLAFCARSTLVCLFFLSSRTTQHVGGHTSSTLTYISTPQ